MMAVHSISTCIAGATKPVTPTPFDRTRHVSLRSDRTIGGGVSLQVEAALSSLGRCLNAIYTAVPTAATLSSSMFTMSAHSRAALP